MLLGHEGSLPQPEGEDGHAQGIEIGLRGKFTVGNAIFNYGVVLGVHLRGGVDAGAGLSGLASAVRAGKAGYAEVTKHHVPAFLATYEDIGGLYVLVDYPGAVHAVQSDGYFHHYGGDCLGVTLEV